MRVKRWPKRVCRQRKKEKRMQRRTLGDIPFKGEVEEE